MGALPSSIMVSLISMILFITTKLLSTSPHQAFPPYLYMTGCGSVKGFSPSLGHPWGNGATTVVNCVQETLSNRIAQPGDHLLRQKGSSPSCLLADLTVSQVGSSPPSQSSGAGLLGQRSRLVDFVWPWIVHVVPVTQRAGAGTLISIWCLPRKQFYDLNLKPSPRRLPSTPSFWLPRHRWLQGCSCVHHVVT